MIDVKVIKDFTKESKKLEEQIQEEIAGVLAGVMADIAIDSLKECPKLTGALRESLEGNINGQTVIKGSSSAVVTQATPNIKNEEVIEGVISYDTPYALKVHEVKAQNYTTADTKWKYLEDPFNQHSGDLEEAISKALKGILK